MSGLRARPVLTTVTLIGSVRFIWFKYRKRNFSGPPLGGLAKNKSKSDHFKWFDVCPDATHLVCPSSQYPVLKVHALRLIRSHRAARQGDILPDRRGPRGRESGRTHFLHILRPCLRLPAVLYRSPRASLSCSVIWLKLIGSLGQGTAGIEQPIALLHREPLGIYANHRFGPAGADQQPGVILECQT